MRIHCVAGSVCVRRGPRTVAVSPPFRPQTEKERKKARERIARADAKIREDLAKIKPAREDREERPDEYSWGTVWAKSDVVSRWRERHELGGIL